MYESLGIETLTAPQAAVWFGVVLGLVFGVIAEVTRFCLRRAVAGSGSERGHAAGVWAMALAAAVGGTQLAVAGGYVDFTEHRFLATDLPYLAIALGGLLFGAGMILTRGCVSRLGVLSGSGNLRAVLVLVVFAITAHATLKGLLAPVRTALGSITVPLGDAVTLAALPGGATLWAALLVTGLVAFAVRSGAPVLHLALAVALGLLVPAGWVGTGLVLFDDFDPIALESLSFTAPVSETLFWTVASTSIPASFGVGLFGGVLAGAAASALTTGRFQWQSFETPRQTGRYLTGAMMMGLGGVLAGGCTVGAGLSGVATLSVAAILALLSVILGAALTHRLVDSTAQGTAIPAE